MENNKSKVLYIIICALCIMCITATGAILLKIQSVNNSQIMPAGIIRQDSPSISPSIEEKVNINTASKSELMLLENIGSKKADDIIAYRQTRAFKKPEDLMNVSGIGLKTFEKIKDYICVN